MAQSKSPSTRDASGRIRDGYMPQRLTEPGVAAAIASKLDAPQAMALLKKAEVVPAAPRPARPLVVFSMDDSPYADKSVVMPILTEKGIKGSFCIKTDNIVNGPSTTALTWADLRQWQAAGHEIVSHTVTHKNLTTEVTTAQLEAELVDSKAALVSRGLDVVGFCYPYSASNAAVRERVRAHYQYGLGGSGSTVQPVSSYAIQRRGLGSGSDPAALKVLVDTAITNNELLIFLIHAGYDLDAAGQATLREIIDYVKSKSVSIVTAREAFQLVGNVVDVGDYVNSSSTQYHVVSGNGTVKSKPETSSTVYRGTNSVQVTDGPDTFLAGAITYASVNSIAPNGNTGQWPQAGPGNVITNRIEPAYNSWTFQDFLPTSGTATIWRRRASGTSTWGAWQNIGGSTAAASTHKVETAMDANAANKLITEFSLGTTITTVPNPGSTGPGGQPGVLRTVRALESTTYPGYNYQEWFPYQGTGIQKRYATAEGWSAWQVMGGDVVRQNAGNSAACAKVITDYSNGQTIELVPAPTTGGSPGGAPGVLTTHKYTSDTTYPGYNFQTYHVYGTSVTTDTYKRNAASATTWTPWLKITQTA